MAKKIIISYTSNPVANDEFKYKLRLNGVFIPFGSLTETKITYRAQGTGNSNPYGVEIQSTLDNTIENTVIFLQGQYSHPNIVYSKVGQTLEIVVNIEGVEVIDLVKTGTSFTVAEETVDFNEDSNVIYFFEYDNVEGVRYSCKISKVGFVGTPTEIQGKAILTKGSVKDHLDTFRGGGLDIELEATESLNLSDLYTEDERTFTVRFFRGTTLLFRGFLKPDGVFQSFVRDRWILNLTCIDGLGALENLSFVKNNGLFFTGKMKAIDIVYNCLNRIGLPMKFNTCINTYYDGLTPSNTLDPLSTIYLSVDRFIKTDDSTIMSCEEVLKSVLDIFCAVITQIDGEWYIYKPNELYASNFPIFRRYSETGNYIGTKQINVGNLLGSQINNFYPHHCNANQQISIKGAISAYRLGYKYGKLKGLIKNSSFEYSGNILLPYENWTLNFPAASGLIIFDPTNTFGLKTYAIPPSSSLIKLATSDSVPLEGSYSYVFKSSIGLLITLGTVYNTDFNVRVRFKVRTGTYFLDIDGNWTTTDTSIDYVFRVSAAGDLMGKINTFNFETKTKELPVDSNVFIEFYSVRESYNFGGTNVQLIAELNSCDITPAVADSLVGEFHTVQRQSKPSTLIKANNTVYNGDRNNAEYVGDIFKEDQLTPTSIWSRASSFEQFPLLRIAAEEELRIQQKPLKEFKGDAYGYIPYLSITNINNVGDKFMPIEWEYDTFRNITKVKFLELYAEEINDIDYKFTFDYGNITRPTIMS